MKITTLFALVSVLGAMIIPATTLAQGRDSRDQSDQRGRSDNRGGNAKSSGRGDASGATTRQDRSRGQSQGRSQDRSQNRSQDRPQDRRNDRQDNRGTGGNYGGRFNGRDDRSYDNRNSRGDDNRNRDSRRYDGRDDRRSDERYSAPPRAYYQEDSYSTGSSRNEWRSIAVGFGALSIIGLLEHDNRLAFVGAAGALYSLDQYDRDRYSDRQFDRARAHYFDCDYFYRDGVRYNRRTVERNGNRYYQFVRSR